MARADEEMMRQAIIAAGRARTHPNPRVGAVVAATDGTVVGRGGHRGPGTPHAELVALREAGHLAAGSTLYVTLEPCVHHGRTPPCAEAVTAAGIRRVVVGLQDPDPRVAGRGIRTLRAAGLDVVVGVLSAETRALDPGYFHQRTFGRPRVTLKAALTLDGQIAAADGSSRWITSKEARADGHLLRADSDAVMVGAGTLLADNPRLTVRVAGHRDAQPVSLVVAGRRPLPSTARVFARTAIVLSPHPVSLPADVIVIPGSDGSTVDLAKGLAVLAERGIADVLVEGGARLASGLLQEGLIDRGVFYIGASLGGGRGVAPFDGCFETVTAARPVELIDVRRVGPDVRIEFEMGSE